MMSINRFVLVAVIHCAFVATVRADASCDGLNPLDSCSDVSSGKVCVKTEETDSTGVNCELDCVKLCDAGASLYDDCSGEHGTAKMCQNVCDCQDSSSCQLACKPLAAAGIKKKKKVVKKKKALKGKKVKKGK